MIEFLLGLIIGGIGGVFFGYLFIIFLFTDMVKKGELKFFHNGKWHGGKNNRIMDEKND